MTESTDSARPPEDLPDDRHRVFLVVVDDSEEMQVAMRFACLRAKNTGGRVALLYVQEPAEFHHWLGVGELI
ncbi:MAG TPA: universal stress protein, partial [Rhodospirillaceae bacterium]|nr:universal stress protein [Rhodospirillaceae bacterium]